MHDVPGDEIGPVAEFDQERAHLGDQPDRFVAVPLDRSEEEADVRHGRQAVVHVEVRQSACVRQEVAQRSDQARDVGTPVHLRKPATHLVGTERINGAYMLDLYVVSMK